jgi:HlyD family secretion protein
MPSSSAQRIHTIAVVAVLVAAAGILAFVILRPGVTAQRPPGVVQPTEVKIGPEISGRFLRLAVAPGQSVRKGDTLAQLLNPELEKAAHLGEARKEISISKRS